MTWDICVIDDSIPVTGELEVDDTASLNISILKLLLEKNKWDEKEVEELLGDLCSGSGDWNVLAFTHPDIYLQTSEAQNYKPDIIIFDWDYPVVVGGDISQTLLKVVRNSFSLVYVYTHVDKDDEVRRELSGSIFNEFWEKRLFLLHKWTPDSEQTLLQKAKQEYEENFAFRFGRILRLSTGKAIEDILVGLGKGNIDFVLKLLNDEATQETDVKQLISQQVGAFLSGNGDLIEELRIRGLVEDKNAQALIELIRGRIESHISSLNFEFPDSGQATDSEASFSKEFWSNRLYYKPSDKIVRKADIVFCSEGQRYYFVISADCDLNRFWHKNFGYINLIRALNLSTAKEEILNLLTITRTQTQAQKVFTNFKQNSITSKIDVDKFPDGPLVLPFVEHIDGNQYLMLLPKTIESRQIIPDDFSKLEAIDKRKKALTYDQWPTFSRIATVFEPFASAIIQHCLKTISGYGTPNYPDIIKSLMKADIAGFINGQPNQETT